MLPREMGVRKLRPQLRSDREENTDFLEREIILG